MHSLLALLSKGGVWGGRRGCRAKSVAIKTYDPKLMGIPGRKVDWAACVCSANDNISIKGLHHRGTYDIRVPLTDPHGKLSTLLGALDLL